MKKSILFFVATMLVSGTLLAQSDTLRLDRIRVVFPGKVQVEEQGPAKRCQLRLADSSANFQVISIDLSTMGLDETTAIAMQAEQAFWDQSRDGLIAQLGSDAKLIKDEMIDYKGAKVMQMHIERLAKEGGVNLLTLRMLIVGTYMIQYGHTDRNGKADVQLRDQFLASLQIN
jgi:uncharacterized protein YqfA (UPF0365 family)